MQLVCQTRLFIILIQARPWSSAIMPPQREKKLSLPSSLLKEIGVQGETRGSIPPHAYAYIRRSAAPGIWEGQKPNSVAERSSQNRKVAEEAPSERYGEALKASGTTSWGEEGTCPRQWEPECPTCAKEENPRVGSGGRVRGGTRLDRH